MNAEQIRKIQQDQAAIHYPYSFELSEIAAQLAEIKDLLRVAIEQLTFSPKTSPAEM